MEYSEPFVAFRQTVSPRVDERARNQIRLILNQAGEDSRKDAIERVQSVYDECNRRGMLNSSVVVSGAIKALEEDGRQFIEKYAERVGKVSKEDEVFEMLVEAFDHYLTFLTGKFGEALKRGMGNRASNLQNQFLKMWEGVRLGLLRQLEIHRYEFAIDQTLHAEDPALTGTEKVRAEKNKGGKPLAEHWDAMWAAIAVQLWNVDLEPKSQADIKRAMFAWFNENEIEIGDFAVTQRARALWQAMKASE